MDATEYQLRQMIHNLQETAVAQDREIAQLSEIVKVSLKLFEKINERLEKLERNTINVTH
jgi:hypothetical protein